MWVVIEGSPYSLSSCPLSTLPFLLSLTLLPHVFKAVENQKKKKEKKGMFVKAKKQMGWHMGGLLLCLAHRAGVLFLCVCVPGVWVQFAEP